MNINECLWTYPLISIGLWHLFGLLFNIDHPVLSITEMVQLNKSNWAEGPFDSSFALLIYNGFE